MVLAGGAWQVPIEEEIVRAMRTQPVRTCGRLDLFELAALYKRSRLGVTLNSAPMHVASATRTPVVALFGRDGAAFTPWNVPHVVVTANPFYPKRHPDPREWPFLVDRISVDQVIEAVRYLWQVT